MSDQQPDATTIQVRLHEMRLLLSDLGELGDVDAKRLRRERFTRHITERVLSQIVDLATSINTHITVSMLDRAPASYRGSFRDVVEAGAIEHDLGEALEPSAGMRNILVHDYLEIDYDEVAAAIPLAMEQYGEYVRQVARWLRERTV